jgi:hypothetical protein
MTAASVILDGRYLLGPLIGRGGTSDVYRALDQRTGEQVAVKVVRTNSAARATRLATEARAAQHIDHPHLVRLLDSGVIDNRAYLVMTYVDGPTLQSRLRGGPLGPSATASLGAAVADALVYIHARGIVHRGVKPANILITTGGQVKLADPGMALVADASAPTTAGSTPTTVAYMAPEQLEDHRVGPGADIWSLGQVLLESLTGRRVYRSAPSAVTASRPAALVQIPPNLSESWQVLLRAMLAPAPARRPAAGDVARQLRGRGFWAPRDPWGQPLVAPGWPTVPDGSTRAGEQERAAADSGAAGSAVSTPPPGPFRWRRAAVAGVVALTIAGVVWAVGSSDTPSTTNAQAPTATAPRTSGTTNVARLATAELAALRRDINAGVAAGSIARRAGQAVTSEARQAIAAAGRGNRAEAASDLRRALRAVASNALDGSSTTSEAGRQLQADLSTLGATLGVAATSLTRAPTNAAGAKPGRGHEARPLKPSGRGHHGNPKGRVAAGERTWPPTRDELSNQQTNLAHGHRSPAQQHPVALSAHPYHGAAG